MTNLTQRDFPLLEFDATRPALIEPSHEIADMGIAKHCVLCFFPEVIAAVCGDGKAKVIHKMVGEMGENFIYELQVDGKPLIVAHPGVGAPLSAIIFEGLIARGCRKFIACGGAGVLDSEIPVGHIVIPSSAVRDEGTSYHYLPPGREVSASIEGIAAIEATLKVHDVPYIVGKTWTTDAPYRETPDKIALRKAEGCFTVEMEAAAFFAVAQFRDVSFAQLLYGGDDVGGEKWDSRSWDRQTSTREKLFWLAAEACLKI